MQQAPKHQKVLLVVENFHKFRRRIYAKEINNDQYINNINKYSQPYI